MSYLAEQNRFSWLFEGRTAASRELWNHEVAASKSFVALPSLGSIVPGWLLVVPLRRMLSLRDTTAAERAELLELARGLSAHLEKFGGSVYAFEHGSASVGSLSGCGVDQAHLHLVPLSFDLIRAATETVEIDWKAVDGISFDDLPPENEYVAVWRLNDGRGAIGKVHKPVSQWMRRLIAAQLGIGEEWNYRTNPQVENIRQTVDVFRRMTPLMK